MALTPEEIMLLQIIEYNQKKIDELLLSTTMTNKESPVSVKCDDNLKKTPFEQEQGSAPKTEEGDIPADFKGQPHEISEDAKCVSVRQATPKFEIIQDTVMTECINVCPPDSKIQSDQPSKSARIDRNQKTDKVTAKEQVSVIIPGLGDSPIDSQNRSEPLTEAKSKPEIALKPLPGRNVWVITKTGKRRRKARSSSPQRALPPVKRKRYSSDCSSPSAADAIVAFDWNSASQKLGHKVPKMPIVVENDEPISSSKFAKKQIASSPGPGLTTEQQHGQPSPKSWTPIKFNLAPEESPKREPEPYVACWAHCPAISTRMSSDHCVPKHLFIDHLRKYHTPPTYINLLNQQIVCICHACETVVSHTHQSKLDHLSHRCVRWHEQFFLFVENARDDFAIVNFNAPVVKSPGLAGMFKSITCHRHLDTLAWKNVKGEHFCYHYCWFCNSFVDDTLKDVHEHTSAALHRVNVRKAGG